MSILWRTKITKRRSVCRSRRRVGLASKRCLPYPLSRKATGSPHCNYRQEARPFSQKQIQLVKDFGTQVVIGLEIARLLNELREKTNELERSYAIVQQQARQLDAQAQVLGNSMHNLNTASPIRPRHRTYEQAAALPAFAGRRSDRHVRDGGGTRKSSSRDYCILLRSTWGFTGFNEMADAEDVMVLCREYHAAVGKSIIRYSGDTRRYAGDGVMGLVQ